MKRLPSLTRLTLAALLAGAASCSGGGPEASTPTEHLQAALAATDPAAAVEHFDAAIAALGDDTASPLYKEAVLGKVAQVAKDNPGDAYLVVAELAAETPDLFSESELGKAANSIADAGGYQEALDLINKIGQKQFPDSTGMADMYTAMLEKVKSSASPEELEALESLGYL